MTERDALRDLVKAAEKMECGDCPTTVIVEDQREACPTCDITQLRAALTRAEEVLSQGEDESDIEAVAKALAESDERIPYEETRKELGLGEPDYKAREPRPGEIDYHYAEEHLKATREQPTGEEEEKCIVNMRTLTEVYRDLKTEAEKWKARAEKAEAEVENLGAVARAFENDYEKAEGRWNELEDWFRYTTMNTIGTSQVLNMMRDAVEGHPKKDTEGET